MSVTELTLQETYRQGVDLLLCGRAAEAVEMLEPVATSDFPFARLALAKAYLELRNGAMAAEQLDALLERPPRDAGFRSYLHLLAASAAALDGGTSQSERHFAASMEADSRMELAVRALQRRVQKGRPPLVRF